VKRFRFRPQILLDRKRRKLEELEAYIAQTAARRASSEARAKAAKKNAAAIREAAVRQDQIDVGDLRAAAAWATRLDEDSAAAKEAARRLALQSEDALARRLDLRREVEGLERLRERALAGYRRAEEIEEDRTATELFLARRRR